MIAGVLDGRCILVVEDDYIIAQKVRRALEQLGATVLGPVPSVRKALRLIEGEPRLDGAVLDVNLGNETSFAIAETLQTRGVRFLFATGYNSGDIPIEWQHANIVMKPLHTSSIVKFLAAPDGT